MRVIVTLAIDTHTDVLTARRKEFGERVADAVQRQMDQVVSAESIHVAPVKLAKPHPKRERAARAAMNY